MSSSTPSSSILAHSSASLVANLFHKLGQAPPEFWRRALWAGIIPFLGSIAWHYAQTVVHVTDDEQSLWIQMWLAQQRQALRRVRHFRLLSPAAKRRNQQEEGYMRRVRRAKEQDEKEDDNEDRFAPPKLEFEPATGVWTWFGWWPVSILHRSDGQGPSYEDVVRGRSQGRQGYTVIVWLAPRGTAVLKDILMVGRQLWLAKRATKTEVWMFGRNRLRHEMYKVVTRPSRPLFSVIVDGNLKELLRQDAIRFLGSEKWYVGKGIPYRRGYLLHGPPGCGKSSLVTALAGELRLPIVVIPLNSKNLDDQALCEALDEAPRDSVILLEDVDCALPRGAEKQSSTAVMARMTGQLPVTLSGLLNAIDGVGAQEGRLLFMTTNHLDRLDEALIRPGRIDVKFHLGKATKAAAGELFDQFFSPSSAATSEYNTKVIKQVRENFLTKISDGAHSFATLQGILTTARDDPRLVEEGMQNLLASMEATEGEHVTTNWDTLVSLESLSRGALEKEKKYEESQRKAGAVVVKRLAGNPSEPKHDWQNKVIKIGSFSTYGAPEMAGETGVLYYEIEIVKSNEYTCTQFGFALIGGIESWNGVTEMGTGDNDSSWAVDGFRSLKWHNEDAVNWACTWKDGSVIGLAVNIDVGLMAVSLDGTWESKTDGVGHVFQSESIRKGVFPCFTASHCKLRYGFVKEDWRHQPPSADIWKVTEQNGIKTHKANGN